MFEYWSGLKPPGISSARRSETGRQGPARSDTRGPLGPKLRARKGLSSSRPSRLLLDDVFAVDPTQEDERGRRAKDRQCDQRPECVLIARHERLRCEALVLGSSPEDGGCDRDTDCPADLLARIDQTGGEAGLRRRHL